MSASRDRILRSVRAGLPGALPRPNRVPEAVRFDEPARAFEQHLEGAGGQCLRVPDVSGIEAALAALDPPPDPARSVGRGGFAGRAPEASWDALARLDLVVLDGSVAVAESGAVWVVPRTRAERAAAFLAERLVLCVPESGLVHDLHQAYARIELAEPAFGCFIAGPSKTADIEQALVIGAHGPRSLYVLLYGETGPTS